MTEKPKEERGLFKGILHLIRARYEIFIIIAVVLFVRWFYTEALVELNEKCDKCTDCVIHQIYGGWEDNASWLPDNFNISYEKNMSGS